ncbi:MAG: acyl-CoA thioester hydrolase [Mariniblastus sp.]|jgi:acyl-CoA thioester hydrolase
MTSVNPSPVVPRDHEMQIRVRYQETDAQGRVHHTNYISYFELARVEMLRTSGKTYRDLESDGIMLVVINVNCNYYVGANYDDLLTIKTKVTKAKGVRIHHSYEIYVDDRLVCDGNTVIAAVDPTGKVVRLPKWLQIETE